VHDADHLADIVFCDQAMHVFCRVQKARQSDIRVFRRQVGFIEREISIS
jgi:hypothetical protein